MSTQLIPDTDMPLLNIPQELQALPQWVCWSVNTPGKGGPKTPLNAHTHPDQRHLEFAKVTDQGTWAPFDLAMEQVTNGRATGVGFVFTKSDPYSGIDLDHCIINGQVSPWAQNVVALLESYTEISPSGTGLHVVIKNANNIPRRRLTWDNGADKSSPGFKALEADAADRYHRMTGDQLPDSPDDIAAHGPRLAALLLRNADKKPILAIAADGFGANRNDAFMSLAGLLRQTGSYEEQALLDYLNLINRTCNVPPAPEEEIAYIAHSACKYEKKKARAGGMPVTTFTGKPVACCVNAQHLLPSMPMFDGLWYNEFDQSAYIKNKKLTDKDAACAKDQLEVVTEIAWNSLGTVMDALVQLSRKDSRHPVRDWLRSLEWDKTERLNTWLCRYIRTDDDAVISAFGRLFLVSAVARVFRPGCDVRQVLLLTGPQNIGKSRLGSILAGPEWFSAGLSMALTDKDAMQALWGNWIVEMPELSSMNRTTVEAAKAFISRSTDKFRAPYDRLLSTHPRQCVIIATSNDEQPLKDFTGNTRFLPVRCEKVCDQVWLMANREQIWAEAYAAFVNGAQWWDLPEDVWAKVESRRDRATEEDSWEEVLRERFEREKPTYIGMLDVLQNWLNVPLDKQETRVQKRTGLVIAALIRRGLIPYKKARIGSEPHRKNVWQRNIEAGPGKTNNEVI